jgi:hypothetical protein
MSVPYEVLASPFEAYWAPVGTAFPAINASPPGPWALIGTSGNANHSEEGITVTSEQTYEDIMVSGHNMPAKKLRLTESLVVSFTVYDMTLEVVRLAFNTNAVAAAAGPPAIKTLQLERGTIINALALLLRGPSPYLETVNMQYQLPRVVHTGGVPISHRRTGAAGVVLEFSLFADATVTAGQRYGQIVAGTA